MSRVGKRPVPLWSPVAARGDRLGDEDRTAPDFDSTHFEQIAVRITEIDGLNRPHGARSSYGTFDDVYTTSPDVIFHLLQRNPGYETQVPRAGGGSGCLRFKLLPGLMQVDLLLPESQRRSPISKSHHFHPEDAGIEITGRLDIANGEHAVIQPLNLH